MRPTTWISPDSRSPLESSSDADPGDLPGSTGTIRYGAGVRRVTHAPGSDVLPAFNTDGSLMIWSSRRGEAGTVQLWVADFVMDLDGS